MTVNELSLEIPTSFWDQTHVDADDGRLAGVMAINGSRFHVEAIPVTKEQGMQVGADVESESRLSGLVFEFDVRGFQTIEINQREYVVIITPFSL
ncbi:MAG: hypothetical protein GQE15_17555 [Archangiaceae bacterium]|nr:hypothetical protein [Archangiaceae bacterium]